MNAIPMIQHSAYHQRTHHATCKECGSAMSFVWAGIKSLCPGCRDWTEPVPVGPCPVCHGGR